MTWTHDKPTLVGWYWTRDTAGGIGPLIARIYAFGATFYVEDMGPGDVRLDEYHDEDREWCGPIEAPP